MAFYYVVENFWKGETKGCSAVESKENEDRILIVFETLWRRRDIKLKKLLLRFNLIERQIGFKWICMKVATNRLYNYTYTPHILFTYKSHSHFLHPPNAIVCTTIYHKLFTYSTIMWVNSQPNLMNKLHNYLLL